MEFTIRRLDVVDSTNSWLQRCLEQEGAKKGLVVWAEEQTAGRGHGQNSWESEPGKNLTFSLLLQPLFVSPEQQFLLTQMVSLTIANEIKTLLPQQVVKIKWPNDILIDGKKVAGILIQNFIRGQNIDRSIVGIGLNVNQHTFLPDTPNPVSLMHFTGKPLNRESLLDSLLARFSTIYTQALSMLFREKINQDYLSQLYLYLKPATFRAGGDTFRASIVGTADYGKLLLQLENGQQKSFGFKEVEFLG